MKRRGSLFDQSLGRLVSSSWRPVLLLLSFILQAGGRSSCSSNWLKKAVVPFTFSGLACSNDGSDVVLTTDGDFIYVSFNFGVGMVSVADQAKWVGVATSSSGKFSAAVAHSKSSLYFSSNLGQWSSISVQGAGSGWFSSVAMPASTTNGFPLLVAQAKGLVYEVQSPSQTTERPGLKAQSWVGVAVSADGQRGYAAGDSIYRFENQSPWTIVYGPTPGPNPGPYSVSRKWTGNGS